MPTAPRSAVNGSIIDSSISIWIHAAKSFDKGRLYHFFVLSYTLLSIFDISVDYFFDLVCRMDQNFESCEILLLYTPFIRKLRVIIRILFS